MENFIYKILTDKIIFNWIIFPIMIFFARILDVSIGTLRIMYLTKGNKLLAPIFGFFEVLIWLTILTNIIKNLSSPLCYIAYAAGFAMGNFVGMKIEEKISSGKLIVRVILTGKVKELVTLLSNNNFGVTYTKGNGAKGKVYIVYSIVDKSNLEDIIGIIKQFNPKAFYSVEDVKIVNEGVFPEYKLITKHTERKKRLFHFRPGK